MEESTMLEYMIGYAPYGKHHLYLLLCKIYV